MVLLHQHDWSSPWPLVSVDVVLNPRSSLDILSGRTIQPTLKLTGQNVTELACEPLNVMCNLHNLRALELQVRRVKNLFCGRSGLLAKGFDIRPDERLQRASQQA